MRGGARAGAGRPAGTKKEPTVVYYRRIKPEWTEILDNNIKELKMKEEIIEKLEKLENELLNLPEDFEEFKKQTNKVNSIHYQLSTIDIDIIGKDKQDELWQKSWNNSPNHYAEDKFNHDLNYIKELKILLK